MWGKIGLAESASIAGEREEDSKANWADIPIRSRWRPKQSWKESEDQICIQHMKQIQIQMDSNIPSINLLGV